MNRLRLISFFWGVAEASFFFFVPDIWLSRVAILCGKESIINIFITVLGALTGGTIMYIFGYYNIDKATWFINLVPAISDSMIKNVFLSVNDMNFLKPMVKGAFSGVPYKIYAIFAGYHQLSFGFFLVITIIARIPRFMLVVLVTIAIKKQLKTRVDQKKIMLLHIMVWVLFYGYYFYINRIY